MSPKVEVELMSVQMKHMVDFEPLPKHDKKKVNDKSCSVCDSMLCIK